MAGSANTYFSFYCEFSYPCIPLQTKKLYIGEMSEAGLVVEVIPIPSLFHMYVFPICPFCTKVFSGAVGLVFISKKRKREDCKIQFACFSLCYAFLLHTSLRSFIYILLTSTTHPNSISHSLPCCLLLGSCFLHQSILWRLTVLPRLQLQGIYVFSKTKSFQLNCSIQFFVNFSLLFTLFVEIRYQHERCSELSMFRILWATVWSWFLIAYWHLDWIHITWNMIMVCNSY